MKELLTRLFSRDRIPNSPSPAEPRARYVSYNPQADPDAARRRAIHYIPGVVNGTVSFETPSGRFKIDFDNRDELQRPTGTLYPKD